MKTGIILASIVLLMLSGCTSADEDSLPLTETPVAAEPDSVAAPPPVPVNEPETEPTCDYGNNTYNATSDCFRDADGDGVRDADDQCPGEDDSIDSEGDGQPDCLVWTNYLDGTCTGIQSMDTKYRLVVDLDPTMPCSNIQAGPWTWETGQDPPQ